MADPTELISVSAVVPTRNRSLALQKTLESLAGQSAQPAEIILVDSSDNEETRMISQNRIAALGAEIKWIKANQTGAAVQRNQGVGLAKQPFIWFFDDDILFEPNCVERLWKAISSDAQLGGVNAMIANQNYGTPGAVSRFVFRWMDGKNESNYAGRVVGPGINLLPADRPDLPEIVPVEWLNTTCTIYRREALPDSPFPAQFTGYSLMEDLALSLEVGKKWKLANVRTARILHDSQPADYKCDPSMISCMELVNRHFVMTQIMGKRAPTDHLKLALWELFSLASSALGKTGLTNLPSILRGKWRGLGEILSGNRLP